MSLLGRLRRKQTVPEEVLQQGILIAQEAEAIREAKALPELDAEGNDPSARIVYARIIQVRQGYAYELLLAGAPFIRQDFHPDKAGNVPMTKEEAEALAKALAAKHQEALDAGN